MSEADRLWQLAMISAARKANTVAYELQDPRGPVAQGFRMLASEILHTPRPAGWGEGGKDE